MSEEERKETSLVDAAPLTLRRTSDPVVTMPKRYDDVSTFDYWQDADRGTEDFLDKFKTGLTNGEVVSWNLPARRLLELGLSIPKDVKDTEGYWFTDTVRDLRYFIMEQRFGRKGARQPLFSDDAHTSFELKSEKWQKETWSAASYANLWEMGVLIEGENGDLRTLSISTPWDETYVSWFKRLTPKKIFIGRERELNMFNVMLTGKSVERNNIEAAFNATDTQVWWGQAMTSNLDNIVRGRYEEIRRKIGIPFSKRVLDDLKASLPTKEVHELIRNAKRISGYYVKAYKGKLPTEGSVEVKFYVDTNNWVAPIVITEKPTPSRGTFEYLEANKPPSERMWIHGAGSLYNTEDSKEHGSFSVFIVLEKNGSGEDRVNSIQISRRVKLRDGLERDFIYYIGHGEFGDGVYRGKHLLPRQEEIESLSVKDWELVVATFNLALERVVVDSTTYWNREETTGITKENDLILQEAAAMLEEKIKKVKRKN